jgi:mRNA-degrading endonuclease toxin of MazEF toxin-antitoxin module
MYSKLKYLNSGDIILGEVKDAKGHEQNGYRTLLVISDSSFNEANDFVIVMPLSRTGRNNENDAIEVKTVHGNVEGYVLTQHIAPFYEGNITVPSSKVKVVDYATTNTMEKAFERYNAITAYTKYLAVNLSQGDIVKTIIGGKKINAVVLSENSFNNIHNTVWVAPITVTTIKHSRDDHVLIKEFTDEEASKYYYILCEHVKNIDIQAREVEKSNLMITESELTSCLNALNKFI